MTHGGRRETGPGAESTVVVIPLFNDWEPALELLEQLQEVAGRLEGPTAVVLVDDGSTEPAPAARLAQLAGFASVEILRLRRNLGHQRAIALGLAFVHRHRPCRAVLVMDGDGEDGPQDVPALLARCRAGGWSSIVFARRTRRSEGLLFLLGYQGFRAAHYVLTGLKVDVGNFSVIPFALLDRVVGVSELWNHYAAAVIHARLPVEKTPVPRRRRLAGRPRMNTTALVVHGLSAISVYGEQIGARLLLLVAALITAGVVAVAAILVAAAFAGVRLPPWWATAAGFAAVGLLNLLLLSMVFVLFVLQSRNNAQFLPLRDWEPYVAGVELLKAQTAGEKEDVSRGSAPAPGT